MKNKKEFKLTKEFMNNGAIHCNTKEEYNNMIEWFESNNIKIDLHDRERGWDYENLYIAYDNTFCNSWYICVSDYSYNDKSCNYDIVEWTDYMSQDIKPKEIETKTADEKEITFEDIDISNEGYKLNCINKNILDGCVKENDSDFLYINSQKTSYSEIPNLIKWLQDIYTYGQQILKEIEYVDFQTALEWMKQGRQSKLGDIKYSIDENEFKAVGFGTPLEFNLSQIESKKWILIK